MLQLGSTGARLIAETEFVASNGERVQARRRNRASLGFATDFTRKYAALARAEPIYAELRNVMDLSIIAAAIQFLDTYNKCDWQPGLFVDSSLFDVQTRKPISKLPTAVNAVWKGRRLLTPVGGGVSILTGNVLASTRLVDETILDERPDIPLDLKDEQWWWE